MAQLCGLTTTEDRFRAVIPGNFGSLHPDAPILSLLGQAGACYINCLWSGFRYRESFAGENFAACVKPRTSISPLSVSVQKLAKGSEPFRSAFNQLGIACCLAAETSGATGSSRFLRPVANQVRNRRSLGFSNPVRLPEIDCMLRMRRAASPFGEIAV